MPNLMEIGLIVVVLLFSIIIHEVAHGYAALMNGDPTARLAGRITLNPLPHIDLVGTIILPLLLLATKTGMIFGWAKPVPVNPYNFRNLRWGEITVSLAGPLSNLLLAAVFAFLYHLDLGGPGLKKLAYAGVVVNIFLALFNLIPIPPLDGSHIVAALLPYNLARLYQYLEPFGFILLIALFYTGVVGFFLFPIYLWLRTLLLGF
ncbi:MAG: site-2 protease family protein [Deltaproteobacteria bacterium]|nr:site-2 protease family protein [Deltaproteobacteria bacterium]